MYEYKHISKSGSDTDSICGNIMDIGIYMVFHILSYPSRHIYCDAGCIHGCFLGLDFDAEEGVCDVSYKVDCPLCIVNYIVLEIWGYLLLYVQWIIEVLGFCSQRAIGVLY